MEIHDTTLRKKKTKCGGWQGWARRRHRVKSELRSHADKRKKKEGEQNEVSLSLCLGEGAQRPSSRPCLARHALPTRQQTDRLRKTTQAATSATSCGRSRRGTATQPRVAGYLYAVRQASGGGNISPAWFHGTGKISRQEEKWLLFLNLSFFF